MTEEPKVVVSILAWNSMTHIPSCLDALNKQNYHNRAIYIVDQASLDGVDTWVREHYPTVHVIRNTRNLGYAHGHNQVIRLTDAPYILVLNPDVVIEPEWIKRAVNYMEQNPKVGSMGGKLLRFTYSNEELKNIVTSGIIDSAGIKVRRSRHVFDRGSGEKDTGQFNQTEDVFGHSGACVMFRRKALETVRYKEEYFDDNFFAYKEDIDLAWRLQRQGWRSVYLPVLIGHHHRQAKGISAASDRMLAKTHRSRNNLVSYLSYRNHFWLLIKNESWSTWGRDILHIGWYEMKKLGFLLLTNPGVLRGIGSTLSKSKLMRQKASLIKKQSVVSAASIRTRWIA